MNVKEFFNKVFGFEPYPYQAGVWDLIFGDRFPVLLKAPTGSGKTEAVLAPFLAQFISGKFSIAPRLIYVLPMRVLVNTLAERIESYAQRVSPHITVKIQHGDIPDAPFFISDIVVTTLDQFLYAFARSSLQVGRHLDIPAGAIASSLVVFDEAHMYRDEFTFSIMRALMEILYHSNIPFVLMTATLPESLRNSLFENISLSTEQEIVVTEWAKGGSSLEIILQEEPLVYRDEINIPEELIPEIMSKKTLIILNQVARAQRLYQEIKRRFDIDDQKIVLLHSRFTHRDRKEHEQKALSLLPHKRNGKKIIPEGVSIVISTQVLEAGIDFSAELLLTELAPADALIQRAGRCARYEGEKGKLIVFPVEEKERGYLPYEKRHLDATWMWLKKNPNFNIRDFTEVCKFVDETLDYRANDYEARDTLIDLYECTLYADHKPENIQIRKNKSVNILVVDVRYVKSKKDEIEQIRLAVEDILKRGAFKDNSLEVDIKVAWSWFRKGLIKYELEWVKDESRHFHLRSLFERERESSDEDPRIAPYKFYILDGRLYDSQRGVVEDEAMFI